MAWLNLFKRKQPTNLQTSELLPEPIGTSNSSFPERLTHGISSWKRNVFLACITNESSVFDISTLSLAKLLAS